MRSKIELPENGAKRTLIKFALLPVIVSDANGNKYSLWFEKYAQPQMYLKFRRSWINEYDDEGNVARFIIE